MQFQKLFFANAQGMRLAARLDLPIDEKPAAYAIFAHCFTCTKNFNAVVNIDRALTREGIAVLRFDFTGLGESEGDFAQTDFSSNVSDLVAASNFLKEHFEAPKLLIGHSLGGAAVLQAASKVPSCLAVATIATPFDLVQVAGHLKSSTEENQAMGQSRFSMEGRDFVISRQFIEDLEQTRMEEVIRNLRKALLVFHSPLDNIVGIENAARIFQTARHPKSFISLDRADHLLTSREDSRYVGSVLASWAHKYLGVPPAGDRKPEDLKDNRVVVRTGGHGFQTEIIANGHSLLADEPIALGGSDTGPSPYDLLVSALGACTSMTLRMYADRKQWPMEAVVVRLKHRKVHAEDCRQCDTGTPGKGPKIDCIEREIEVQGPLDADQKRRLLEIADKCPVHLTLHSEVAINSRLVESMEGGLPKDRE